MERSFRFIVGDGGDTQLTITAAPIQLHDFSETAAWAEYRAGVGSDGTMYIPVDVSQVSDATTFTGAANGFPLSFTPQSVVMYNMQGFMMQLMDPTVPGLFQITQGLPLSGVVDNVVPLASAPVGSRTCCSATQLSFCESRCSGSRLFGRALHAVAPNALATKTSPNPHPKKPRPPASISVES